MGITEDITGQFRNTDAPELERVVQVRNVRLIMAPDDTYRPLDEIEGFAGTAWAEAWEAGDYYFGFLYAQCEVYLPLPHIRTGFRTLTLTSAGVGGVESNGGEYLAEIGREEIDDLRWVLEQLHLPTDALDGALPTIEEVAG